MTTEYLVTETTDDHQRTMNWKKVMIKVTKIGETIRETTTMTYFNIMDETQLQMNYSVTKPKMCNTICISRSHSQRTDYLIRRKVLS